MLKCPNCEPDSDQFAVVPCPDCRGTGEIQDGDWWMCEHMGNEKQSTLIWVNDAWCCYHISEDKYAEICFQSDIFPLYRMERAR